MTIRNLDKMFSPRTVALFGASDQAGSVGKTATGNLLHAGFDGVIWLVNPRRREVAGQKCWSSADDLRKHPILPSSPRRRRPFPA